MRNVINYPLIDDAEAKETYVEKKYVVGGGVGGTMQAEFYSLESILVGGSGWSPFSQGGGLTYEGPGFYCSNAYANGKAEVIGTITADVYEAAYGITHQDVELLVLEFKPDGRRYYATDLSKMKNDDSYFNYNSVYAIRWGVNDMQRYELTDGYWYDIFYVGESTEGWKVTSITPGVAYCREDQIVMYNGNGGQSVPAFEFIWSGPESTEEISWSDFGFTSDVFDAYVEMYMKKNTTLAEYNVMLGGGSLQSPVVPGTISYSQERYITFGDYTLDGQSGNIKVIIDADDETISIVNLNIE